jgi:hypothetical protein
MARVFSKIGWPGPLFEEVFCPSPLASVRFEVARQLTEDGTSWAGRVVVRLKRVSPPDVA